MCECELINPIGISSMVGAYINLFVMHALMFLMWFKNPKQEITLLHIGNDFCA
jgi:hypothetical protein